MEPSSHRLTLDVECDVASILRAKTKPACARLSGKESATSRGSELDDSTRATVSSNSDCWLRVLSSYSSAALAIGYPNARSRIASSRTARESPPNRKKSSPASTSSIPSSSFQIVASSGHTASACEHTATRFNCSPTPDSTPARSVFPEVRVGNSVCTS